ncbi:serine hydrolase [Streptomyces sp. NPDC086777]|uniref:serine hydrolase n=1 Tax=Streptomyces sp. NPDC086777 TaxID=3154866 RepID=UPI00344F60D3
MLGLIVRTVTGHSPEDEISRRVIRPLGLRDTYWPGDETRATTGPASTARPPSPRNSPATAGSTRATSCRTPPPGTPRGTWT